MSAGGATSIAQAAPQVIHVGCSGFWIDICGVVDARAPWSIWLASADIPDQFVGPREGRLTVPADAKEAAVERLNSA